MGSMPRLWRKENETPSGLLILKGLKVVLHAAGVDAPEVRVMLLERCEMRTSCSFEEGINDGAS
jgi:hypothetical protein